MVVTIDCRDTINCKVTNDSFMQQGPGDCQITNTNVHLRLTFITSRAAAQRLAVPC